MHLQVEPLLLLLLLTPFVKVAGCVVWAFLHIEVVMVVVEMVVVVVDA